jgi:hypothetical protein
MKIIKLLILCCVFIGISLEAAAIKAVIVGDTFSDLGEQASIDIQKIENGVRQIGDALHLPVSITLLKNHQVNKVDISRALKKLSIDSDDIVIFYYTGHGFRKPHQQSQWPNLYFTQNQTHLSFDEIIGTISSKKPRFALVIADCCNSPFVNGNTPTATKRFYFPYRDNGRVSADLKKLFMDTHGILAISGSSPGEEAWAAPHGGLFTIALLDGLDPHSPVSWNELLQTLSSKMSGIQTPQYQFIQ